MDIQDITQRNVALHLSKKCDKIEEYIDIIGQNLL